MKLTVYDLSVEVVMYLVGFQSRLAQGEYLSYDDTRAEVLALLNDLDRRSHTEQGLWEHWVKARQPMVYLIDEVMILNANWNYKAEWSNECLEVKLLNAPRALRGEKFYEECDAALREFETAEQHNRHDAPAKCDIVASYYLALQLGFMGKYSIDKDAWREYKAHVFSKLPAYAQTRTKELFPDVDKHTVLLDPNYEPVMSLLYVSLGFLVVLAIYLGSTYIQWESMTRQLREDAQAVAGATQPPDAAGLAALPSASSPASAPAPGGG